MSQTYPAGNAHSRPDDIWGLITKVVQFFGTLISKLFGGDHASPSAYHPTAAPLHTPFAHTPVRPSQTHSGLRHVAYTPSHIGDATLAGGRVDRSQFARELQDPEVMREFAGRMYKEVGDQGQLAQIAFAETIFNRAAARHQTLQQTLWGSYYPTNSPGASENPRLFHAIETAYLEGTNITNGATGNASGSVGFGRLGYQTAQFGGERFGVESVEVSHHWTPTFTPVFAGISRSGMQV